DPVTRVNDGRRAEAGANGCPSLQDFDQVLYLLQSWRDKLRPFIAYASKGEWERHFGDLIELLDILGRSAYRILLYLVQRNFRIVPAKHRQNIMELLAIADGCSL